jgi:carboxyl-terminal processing protease
VKVETDRPANEVTAGDPMALKVTVTNKGTQPLYRLNAVTKSDNGMYDNKELVFGKLEPGKSKTAVTPLGWCETEGYKPGSTQALPKDAPRVCRIPRDALTRADGIKIHFEEARTWAPADAEIRVSTKALEHPEFLYSYQLADNRKGNGDGRIQRDEEVTMYVTVKNVGKGRSYETQANLRNLSGDGLLLRDGRFDVSNMQPGEVRRVAFTFDVQPQLQDAEAKVELSITDRDLREAAVEKIRMPIATPSPVAAASGTMKARGTADLFTAADPASRVFGRLPPGTAAAVVGKSGDFVKLSLGQNRFGFARAQDLEQGGAAAPVVAFEDRLSQASPSIEIPAPVLATRDGKIQLKVAASDESRLLDAYVFVGSRKIFYKSNRNGADPKKMSFDAELPLRPGVNIVGVYARETPDTVARRTFVIRRDGANGELLATPRGDDELAENAAGGDD